MDKITKHELLFGLFWIVIIGGIIGAMVYHEYFADITDVSPYVKGAKE